MNALAGIYLDPDAVAFEMFLPPSPLPPRAAGARPLDEAHAALCRYVAWPSPEAADAAALWAAHCHLLPGLAMTPRLALLSAEPGSGKTRALEILAGLVPRPLHAFSASMAYLLRRIAAEDGPPTVLLDEADAVFGGRPTPETEALRAALNSGYRRGAIAGRCVIVGKRVETEELPCFAPVALAGLGSLPHTIRSRSILILMRRRRADEAVQPYRPRDDEPALHAIRDRLAAWAEPLVERAAAMRPDLPAGVVDRAADLWEPLIVTAALAGGDWPQRARRAAVLFVKAAAETPPSLGLRLLADIRHAFDESRRDAMPTGELVSALLADPEGPWGDLRGKPLTARALATLLEPYAVRSVQLWEGGKNVRGFRRADFADAWARYLPAPAPRE